MIRDEREFSWCVVLSPWGFWLPRNEAEARLLASRSAVERQPKRAPNPVPASRPDPEVVCQSEAADLHKLSTNNASYREAEVAATTRGGLGALLRAAKVCTRLC